MNKLLIDAEYNKETVHSCLESWEELELLSEGNNQGATCILVDFKAALNILGEGRKRRALTLYYIKGLKQTDVADELGISQQYLSREILPRSVQALTDILGEVEDDE